MPIIFLYEDSFEYRLFSVLSVVGECSFSGVRLLSQSDDYEKKVFVMTENCIYVNPYTGERIECRALNISGEGKFRKIRFIKDSLKLLESLGFLDKYLENILKRKNTYDKDHVIRRARISESAAMMLLAGAEVRSVSLPEISMNEMKKAKDYPCFLNSVFVKQSIDTEQKKTIYTRNTGMLIYPGQAYLVYNIRDETLSWYGHSELRGKIYYQRFCAMCGGSNEITGAVIFGKDYAKALSAMLEIEESIVIKKGSSVRTEYRLDLIYDSMFFIEMNEEGVRFLKTMMIPGWRIKLKKMFFSEYMLRNGCSSQGYDAMKNGKYICMFFDHDIAKLERFKNSQVMSSYRKDCHVFCYPDQVEFVKKYLGEDIVTRTIESEKIYGRYEKIKAVADGKRE